MCYRPVKGHLSQSTEISHWLLYTSISTRLERKHTKLPRKATATVPTATTCETVSVLQSAPIVPLCDQRTPPRPPPPLLNTSTPSPPPSPHYLPPPPSHSSWSLCCCHGDTKPCTLKSALGRSRRETDNNIPPPRQTDTQALVFVKVIISGCVCVYIFVRLSGRWVFRCPCMCKQIEGGGIELYGQTRQVGKICCVLNTLNYFCAVCG